MTTQQPLRSLPTAAQQLGRALNAPHRRAYSIRQICDLLHISRSTFYANRATAPFLEEIRPRFGRSVRFRADLVDRFLDGQWGQPRAFRRLA